MPEFIHTALRLDPSSTRTPEALGEWVAQRYGHVLHCIPEASTLGLMIGRLEFVAVLYEVRSCRAWEIARTECKRELVDAFFAVGADVVLDIFTWVPLAYTLKCDLRVGPERKDRCGRRWFPICWDRPIADEDTARRCITVMHWASIEKQQAINAAIIR